MTMSDDERRAANAARMRARRAAQTAEDRARRAEYERARYANMSPSAKADLLARRAARYRALDAEAKARVLRLQAEADRRRRERAERERRAVARESTIRVLAARDVAPSPVEIAGSLTAADLLDAARERAERLRA